LKPEAIRKTVQALFARPSYLEWYCTHVQVPGLDKKRAVLDFFERAASEDVSPTLFFDPIWFRSKYCATGPNAFLSYLANDEQRLAWPSPLFAPRWYSRRYGLRRAVHPIIDFLAARDRKSPHPLLDANFLQEQSPWWHSTAVAFEFLVDKEKYILNPHPLFDTKFYLETNPDVGRDGVNPLLHYLYYGHTEGRAPNSIFNLSWYRDHYKKSYSKGLSSFEEPLTDYVSWAFSGKRVFAPGLESLTKASIEMTEHGPKILIDCIKSRRNIYSAIKHTPHIFTHTFKQYMPLPLQHYNSDLPDRILFLPQKQVALLHSPKCASATIVYWWMEQAGLFDSGMRFSLWSHNFENLFHESEEYTSSALSFHPDRYHLYKFVRHPVHRVLSSFSHVLGYPETFPLESGRTSLSFNEFLEMLRSTDYLQRDGHFYPQMTAAERYGKVSPTILKIENGLDKILRLVESKHGLPHAERFRRDPDARKIIINHTKENRTQISVGPDVRVPYGKIPAYGPLLTDETLKKIHFLYKEDFEAYGYNLDLVKRPSRSARRRV
jgi:hypothetical protein